MKKFLTDFWNSTYRWHFIIIILSVFLIGFFSGSSNNDKASDVNSTIGEKQTSEQVQFYTCSMHPQIRQPNKGKCPLCAMDLIPVSEDSAGGLEESELKLSKRAVKLAEIQTQPVERKYVTTKIRMVGRVVIDETRVRDITSRVSGRLDRLFVDYTGLSVKKGDHLASIYSPQLISAQKELIEARKYSPGALKSVREKLRLLGITPTQISNIEKLKIPVDHLILYSPIGGVVIHKIASEGMYVNTGDKICTVADLSKVWIELDAYESDINWIRYGQKVEFETKAYPGEKFSGRISFINPVLNPKTRTVKVRITVPNKDGLLKPEMFVQAVLYSKLAVNGKVMDEDLLGKWISPMHPEIVKDRPGKCDICGMALVPADKLGYVDKNNLNLEKPLVIPVTAPLLTGSRAVVYLAKNGEERTFVGRVVVLGARAGDYYIVKEGLAEGDLVVSNGAFKIDSDLQILAKPSMMNPDGAETTMEGDSREGEQKTTENPIKQFEKISGKILDSFVKLTDSYIKIQLEFSNDNFVAVQKNSKNFIKILKKINQSLLKGDANLEWGKIKGKLTKILAAIIEKKDIEPGRVEFEKFTDQIIRLIKTFSLDFKKDIFLIHCPMAFNNRGASWIQDSEDVRNPYFGASMLTCYDTKVILQKGKK